MNNLMKKPPNLSPPYTRWLELEEVSDRGRYNSESRRNRNLNLNLDIEIRAFSTVKWRILFPENSFRFVNYHIRLVVEIGIFVMGLEIKASSNVRRRIISRELLSLRELSYSTSRRNRNLRHAWV